MTFIFFRRSIIQRVQLGNLDCSSAVLCYNCLKDYFFIDLQLIWFFFIHIRNFVSLLSIEIIEEITT